MNLDSAFQHENLRRTIVASGHTKLGAQIHHLHSGIRERETNRLLRDIGLHRAALKLGLPRGAHVERRRAFEHELRAGVESDFCKAGFQFETLTGREFIAGSRGSPLAILPAGNVCDHFIAIRRSVAALSADERATNPHAEQNHRCRSERRNPATPLWRTNDV